MTRSGLLHILDHVRTISEAEVRDLEQLATAFPYCQTAHLLLAKAAHDRGSMLASQRLRRAATYATDRQLLRQLIELPMPAVATEAAQLLEPTVPESTFAAAAPAEPLLIETSTPEYPELVESPVVEAPLVQAEMLPEPAEAVLDALPVPLTLAEAPSVVSAANAAAEQDEEVTEAPVTIPEPAAIAPEPAEAEENTAVTHDWLASEPEAAAVTPEEALQDEEPMAPAVTANQEAEVEVEVEVEPEISPLVEQADSEAELPPKAPPIRPPAEAGAARFEFGLAPDMPPLVSAYELAQPATNEAVEAESSGSLPKIPAFYTDPEVGYGLGEGSRLGYSLVAQVPEFAQPLPPAFFAPDALLLAHARAHQPPRQATPSRSSLDLINQFLRNQPRLKSPGRAAMTEEAQTDLAVRSTQPAPALASESLARILVKQGKTAKAVEIYERLMVLQPEKKAYFAAQIDQLQTPE